jgi:hypothetical protein
VKLDNVAPEDAQSVGHLASVGRDRQPFVSHSVLTTPNANVDFAPTADGDPIVMENGGRIPADRSH